jgi:hypothetical protein
LFQRLFSITLLPRVVQPVLIRKFIRKLFSDFLSPRPAPGPPRGQQQAAAANQFFGRYHRNHKSPTHKPVRYVLSLQRVPNRTQASQATSLEGTLKYVRGTSYEERKRIEKEVEYELKDLTANVAALRMCTA